jgi:hypothetical protein
MNAKEIVHLHPNDEGRLHPVALRRLLEWGEKLSKEIPLSTLSSEDVERWLNKNELAEWQREVEGIREWLVKCLDDEFSIYCHSDWVIYHMMEIGKLIERVWQRKSRWTQQQQECKEAQRKSQEYARELNSQVNSFKTNLSHKKRRMRWPKNARSLGYDFSYLLPSDNRAPYRKAAEHWVRELISNNLESFITFDYWVTWRLLPSAVYSLIDSVPCLDIGFDVFLGIEAKFSLRPGEVLINDYKFMMPQEEHSVRTPEGKVVGSYFVQLTKQKILGYGYRLLSPKELAIDELNYFSRQTIPCALILGLLEGNPEPDGCTITAAHEGWTHYRVDDFDEELKIPDNFAQYLGQMASWDSLTERGIIDSKIAPIIKKAIKRLKTTKIPELGPSEEGELVGALIGLGWSKTQAREAADYVIKQSPNVSLEEKIKSAMRFLNPQVTN